MLVKRTAIVTGGTGGIGSAIAERLVADGHDVIVLDVSTEKITSKRAAGRLSAEVCNVADFLEVEKVIATLEKSGRQIDILVNAAGITRDVMVHKMHPEDHWRAVIEVNLTSVFNTVRCVANGMRQRNWGRIINISSMNGQRGQLGQANYVAAKAGMIGFTKSIALEMAAKGVTANCIAPGFVLTDMTRAMRQDVFDQEVGKIPAGRVGQPEDIAAAASYLASDAAGFVTGQVLAVNGGQYM
jgi:acetoacetyl-CoA reductase